MRISRVYVPQALAIGCTVSLEDNAVHYLKNVLRLKAGATVDLFNGEDDSDYRGQILVTGKSVSVTLSEKIQQAPMPAMHSSIIQGVSRPDHLDWMVQKTTELGVSSIHLFNSRYTQTPVKAVQQEKKLRHWQAIAISACEQSGRTRIPTIHFHDNGIHCLEQIDATHKILLDFDTPAFTPSATTPDSLAILLGPEGGLEESEIAQAKSQGFQGVSLGPRVLRTETAAVTALAIAQAAWGGW